MPNEGHDTSSSSSSSSSSVSHPAMAHEMGHSADVSMTEMVLDMKRRFIVALVLAIPIFIYSPLFT